MNSSAFFSLRCGRIVRSQSKSTSILISLPKLHNFVAVCWFWRVLHSRLRWWQGSQGVLPVLLRTRCMETRELAGEADITHPPRAWRPGADQPSELSHLYLGTGMAELAISDCSRHCPGMSVGWQRVREEHQTAVKMQWQLNSVKNYYCKRRTFLVYVFVIVAGIICLFYL